MAGWVYGFSGASDAQPAVVVVLKCLRRRGHGFKSHPTDWEKSGFEPATPGLQGIALIHYNTVVSRHRLPEMPFAF